jgi:adenylate kinase
MLNIIMLGPPCSGKGTHAHLISESFHLAHISTGDLFRAEIKKASPIGIMAQRLIDHGNFIPDSITMKILYQHIYNNPSPEGYLFDGFPRTLAQAEVFTKYLEKHNQSIDLVLYLNAPEEELMARMYKRAIVDNRADDNNEVFVTRLKNYYSLTHILTEYYLAQGKLAPINTNKPIKEVSGEIFRIINELTESKK